MAIANALKQKGQRVIYRGAETFTEHVVGAIRSGMMQEFRKAYRHADVLLIDDIQILARRGATKKNSFTLLIPCTLRANRSSSAPTALPSFCKRLNPV